jgi:hypothetical protein
LLKINGSGILNFDEIQHLYRALLGSLNVFKQAADQSSPALDLTCFNYSSLGIAGFLRVPPLKKNPRPDQ